ncbi:hypothetical protein [uncultured Vibrio sp.]|uniref:hypothetical protein n=1 Tax=uncultured Vibrio sp. TaxID=114054 RepID=UPI0025F68128|nr:hypothetical protein [uncultured Vibrio sp.]
MENKSKSKTIVVFSCLTFVLGFMLLALSSFALVAMLVIHASFSMFVLHASELRSSSKKNAHIKSERYLEG